METSQDERSQTDKANPFTADKTIHPSRKQARVFDASLEPERLSDIISLHKCTQETQNPSEIYESLPILIKNEPNSLFLDLCIVLDSPQYAGWIHDRALYLLYYLLIHHDKTSLPIFPTLIRQIKQILLYCFRHVFNEFTSKIFSRVVSIVAAEAFASKKGEWDALRDYIIFTLGQDFRKAFRVFQDLPLNVSVEFLMPIISAILPEISKRLDPKRAFSEEKEWVSAFGAAFSLLVQIARIKRPDLEENLTKEILNSVTEMVREGKQEVVRIGLYSVMVTIRAETERYFYSEYKFASYLVSRITAIADIGARVTEAAAKVLEALESTPGSQSIMSPE